MREDHPGYCTVSEAAAAARVSVRTIRTWVASGRVKSRLHSEGGKQIRLILRASLPLLSESALTTITAPHGEDHTVLHSEARSLTLARQAIGELSGELQTVRSALEGLAEVPAAVRALRELAERQAEALDRQERELAAIRGELAAIRGELAAIRKRRPWWKPWGRP